MNEQVVHRTLAIRNEHYTIYVERAKRKGHVVKTFDEWLKTI